MKSSILLLLMLMACGLQAQYVKLLTWKSPSQTINTTANIDACTFPDKHINFEIDYRHCFPNVQCIQSSRIKMEIALLRNNQVIKDNGHIIRRSPYFYSTFPVQNVIAGTYKVRVEIYVSSTSPTGWTKHSTNYSNTITIYESGAVPNFNIDGVSIPNNNTSIQVCASKIIVNPKSTTCATKYYLGVQECDQSWNRTYQYEWGLWFLEKPNKNLDLQNLASTFSVPPYFTGPTHRQNQILFGGNLPSGKARHYRVNICTGEPTWTCKIALIRVNGNCKIGSGSANQDMNTSIPLEHTELIALYDENDVEIPLDESITTKDLFAKVNNTTINVAPNPFSNTTTIRIDNYDEKTPIVFELFNALGERVKSVESTQTQFELQRDQLTAGIYLYRATANNKLIGSGKVVIE